PQNQWFWREWLKVTDGEELLKAEGHIERLKRLLAVGKGRKPKGWFSEEQIQQALAVPIENLINQPLRKSGKTLVGLCPLHNERHPSFFIYPETNSCWCYGCNQGGDVINFIKLLHGYEFKEAVQYLTGK
ncbi:MAG: DNA primase, partial [Parcubacteria group bacterium Gr01-1014_33]